MNIKKLKKKLKDITLKAAYLVFILGPFVALGYGIQRFWMNGVDWISLGLCLAMVVFTGLCITVGFHRYFTHKSFDIKAPWLENLLAIGGMMAVEGPIFTWIETHLQHHDKTDEEDDPHTPHGFKNLFIGFLRAHFFFVWFKPPSGDEKVYVTPHRNNPTMVRLNSLFLLWVVLGFVIPACIGAGLRGSFSFFFIDMMWQVIRMVKVHHITWCINSICHIWGWQPFQTGDESRNNPIVAWFGFGEGWHNNHHKFQYSARHGLLPGQFDISWHVICLLSKLGLIEKIRVPSQDKIDEELARSSTTNA